MSSSSTGPSYTYTRKVKHLNRPVNFTTYFAETIATLAPDALLQREFVLQLSSSHEIQNVPTLSEHGTNTDTKRVMKSTGALHTEGGWPKEVDATEEEQRSRHRRKMEKDENYFASIRDLVEGAVDVLRQNAACDIYKMYFSAEFYEEHLKQLEEKGAAEGQHGSKRPTRGNSPPNAYAAQPNAGGEADGEGGAYGEEKESGKHAAALVGEESEASTNSPSLFVTAKAADPFFSVLSAPEPTSSFGRHQQNQGNNSNRPNQRSIAAISWITADEAKSTKYAVAFCEPTLIATNPSTLAFSASGHPLLAEKAKPSSPQRSAAGVKHLSFEPTSAETIIPGTSVTNRRRNKLSMLSGELHASSSALLYDGAALESFVFDVSNPQHHELELKGSASLTSLQFSPRDVHLLAAGQANGRVCLFDMRRGGSPCGESILAQKHDDIIGRPICDTTWLAAAGRQLELMTVNGSSLCCVWDVRNLETPLEVMSLGLRKHTTAGRKQAPNVPVTAPRHTAVCAEFVPSSASGGKIFAGTSSGCLFSLNRRGRNDFDRVSSVLGSHNGPLRRIARHPHVNRLLATAGDWSVHLWTEEFHRPLMTLPPREALVVDVRWHPTRAPLLALLRADCVVELWNISLRTDEPVTSISLTSAAAMNRMAFNLQGTILSVASLDGEVFLLRVSDGSSLTGRAKAHQQTSERATLSEMVESEYTRGKQVSELYVTPKYFDVTASLHNDHGEELLGPQIRHRELLFEGIAAKHQESKSAVGSSFGGSTAGPKKQGSSNDHASAVGLPDDGAQKYEDEEDLTFVGSLSGLGAHGRDEEVAARSLQPHSAILGERLKHASDRFFALVTSAEAASSTSAGHSCVDAPLDQSAALLRDMKFLEDVELSATMKASLPSTNVDVPARRTVSPAPSAATPKRPTTASSASSARRSANISTSVSVREQEAAELMADTTARPSSARTPSASKKRPEQQRRESDVYQ